MPPINTNIMPKALPDIIKLQERIKVEKNEQKSAKQSPLKIQTGGSSLSLLSQESLNGNIANALQNIMSPTKVDKSRANPFK